MTHDIVPAHLAVKAMRDSGYKNAAYAIAELIDNSIQAGSTEVQLLCAEVERVVAVQRRPQIYQVAVVDNGSGMDSETLRRALQFGNGSHLNDRSGIGRFGMGLPNSSLSQASRVEVWSWQKGGAGPIYSYLDLSEINSGELREVPLPQSKSIPDVWKIASGGLANSGTLVVWSNIDRCQWKTARAIIRNSERTIGRIYRRFINDGRASIRLVGFDRNVPAQPEIDELARVNDPMYLMAHTSCPEPWAEIPMFEPWAESHEFQVKNGDRSHLVRVSFSIAKKSAREGFNPGSRDYGQHAAHNVGVSIMRSDRELEMQLAWTNRHEARERWWGAEVEFPPDLDEVFGVTNDKQSARALADLALVDADELVEREGFSTFHELQEEWERSNDPRSVLLKIKTILDNNLNAIREQLRAQTARSEGRKRHPDSAETKATEATRIRQAEGHRGESDDAETEPQQVRQAALEAGLVELGLDQDDAANRAVQIVNDGRKYEFVHAAIDSDAFFSVRPKGGALLININTVHPAYQHLVALLEKDPDEGDDAAVRQRMRRSYEGLKLLLEAWARYEDELPAAQRDRARDARADWGRVARQFLTP